jgi:hypothetical protein
LPSPKGRNLVEVCEVGLLRFAGVGLLAGETLAHDAGVVGIGMGPFQRRQRMHLGGRRRSGHRAGGRRAGAHESGDRANTALRLIHEQKRRHGPFE